MIGAPRALVAMRHSNGPAPFSRRALLAAAATVLLTAGCATKDGPATTGSIGRSGGDAVQQASTLRAQGRAGDAVKVLRGAVAKNLRSKELMLAYARALADAGQNDEALLAFAKAQDPRKPDWRIMNAEGAVLDRLGRTVDAQQRYHAALRLAPEEPTILSNLGLSLALSEKPDEAEAVLRRAVAQPTASAKIRQNLALVLALQGKYAEAEELARRDLPPDQVAANMRYWKASLSKPAKAKPAGAKPKAVKKAPPAPAGKPAAAPAEDDAPFGLRS